MWYEDLVNILTWEDPLITLKVSIIFSFSLFYLNYALPLICIIMIVFRAPIIYTLMGLSF